MDFAKVLDLVGAFLDAGGFRHAVVGAVGLSAYGLNRATQDLDFVVEAKAQAPLVGFLDGLGYETLHASAGYSNHVHPMSGLGRVDFIYVDEATAGVLFREAGKCLSLGGRTVQVPKPEHLAAMKIKAMKNDPSRRFQEMADIQFLLSVPNVDRDAVRRYFAAQGLLERYEEILHALE